MSYATIYACATDPAFQNRVMACAADEGAGANSATVMQEVIWQVSAADDIEAAYASALAADNPNPGGDEAVITDQMILSVMQANMPPETV